MTQFFSMAEIRKLESWPAEVGRDELVQYFTLTSEDGAPVLIERHWWTDVRGTVLDYAESVEPGERWRTRRYKAGDDATT